MQLPRAISDLVGRLTPTQREYFENGLLATLIGALAGILAVIFRHLIALITEYGFEGIGNALQGTLGPARYAIVPVIGGLIVGPLIWLGAREAKGHGVPEVMDAVLRFGGRLRLRVIGVKAVASAVTIGSGGSSGREGPIVHMGSAVGSNLGQALKMNPARTKILVGCGAAGGIAATFNTPIAGALFAIELILMEFKTRSFIPIVIASVIATIIAPGFDAAITDSWDDNPWQERPAFDLEEEEREPFNLYAPTELVAYLGLGILCGLVALLYIRTLYGLEDLFDRLRFKPWLKPALGGLAVGVIGIAFYQVYGVGYGTVEGVLKGDWIEGASWDFAWYGILLMAALALVKILALSLTLGSGGSGGIFAPALFIGCMVGGAFGAVMYHVFPYPADAGVSIEGTVAAYALVGMASMVAASTRGTLTAIIMIFEMTRVYDIMLPLLFACVIADLTSTLGSDETIYTTKLARRGVRIVHDFEPDVMRLFSVGEVMVPIGEVSTVSPEEEMHRVVALIRRSGHNGFPVVDGEGSLVGVITTQDVHEAQSRGDLFVTAGDLMTTDVTTVTTSDSGEAALRRMGDRRISHLPVVDSDDPSVLVGWLSKGDLVFAYDDYHRRMEAPLDTTELSVAGEAAEAARVGTRTRGGRPSRSVFGRMLLREPRRLPEPEGGEVEVELVGDDGGEDGGEEAGEGKPGEDGGDGDRTLPREV